MAEPLNIRVDRPYTTEDDFLDAEAWSVTARSILLVGVGPQPEGTVVRFELRLTNGQSLIVAEGVVVKHLAASASRPAGLVVRYKRMSAASNDFIKRAVERGAGSRAGSSPSASVAAMPSTVRNSTPPGRPSGAPARAASTTPPRRASSGPPHRGSKATSSERGSVRAPKLQTRPPSNSPRSRTSSAPQAPTAHSVSVIPPARRLSTVPPAPSRDPGSALRPSAAPAKAAATASHRPSGPAPDPGNSPPKRSAAPQAQAESRAPKHGANDGVPGVVPREAGRRDSGAMQRLRSRTSLKALSTPPDREAILSRLKKKPNA